MSDLETSAAQLEEKYRAAYDGMAGRINERIRLGRYPAMGYTTNLDLLCDFQVDDLNRMLGEYLPDLRLAQVRKADRIDTVEDLLETIVYFCVNGIGGEVDIGDTDVVRGSFRWTLGMGGTAPQAAMALAAVGCPSVIHMTDDSPEVCGLLDSPLIYTVSDEGTLIHTGGVRQAHDQEIHFIIQFRKGDRICLADGPVKIPVSNRLILTKITVNETVPFSDSYLRFVEEHAEAFGSNVLSSLNAILDERVLLDRISAACRHTAAYRKKNPAGVVFFEDAHYHNDRVRTLCLENLYSQVDIVSLNEEELKHTLDSRRVPVDMDDIVSCIAGAVHIRETLGVRKGMIVHTKDYSMYVGDPLTADIGLGLIYGNLLATAKAFGGWYGSPEQVGKVLSFPMSPKGLLALKAAAASPYAGSVTLIPTRYIDKPRYTIGLGDSFVAGVQMCF